MSISRFAGWVGIAFGLMTSAARAEPLDCFDVGALSDGPVLVMGRVVDGSQRVYFVKSASDLKGCPDTTEACRAKAFLVPGDRVIVGVKRGGFACTDYIGSKGTDRTGWLPEAALVMEVPVTVTVSDWIGTWSREEASITVAPGRLVGELAIHGDATYGAKDPERVARGGVNIGEIEASLAPKGAALAFAMGDKTLPIEKGQDTDCKVWMRRLGPYLLVDDNSQCGGANVSFRGVYLRKK